MTQIFVFPAADAEAQANLEKSIRGPIDEAIIERHLPAERLPEFRQRAGEDGRLFGWGARIGTVQADGSSRNRSIWEAMRPGDWVLAMWGNTYRFAARIVGTIHSADFARALWGADPEGNTFELVFLLDRPVEVHVPLSDVAALHSGYRGLARISEERLAQIRTRAGSVDRFIESTFLGGDPLPPPAPETPQTPQPTPPETTSMAGPLKPICDAFSESLLQAGLTFQPDHHGFVRAFLVGLMTKRFAILTGLSGSGKTQIALQLGAWLGPDRSCLVPVRPDWTGPEAVLGFEDALRPLRSDGRRAWQVPVPLQFILEARSRPMELHLLILDEMNLAHVERYFADLLSGMESGEPCLPNLERANGDWVLRSGGQPRIQLPSNLMVVGTVNVDETTYLFSPKVLDRANTYEFRVPTEALAWGGRRPEMVGRGPADLLSAFRTTAVEADSHLDAGGEDWPEVQHALRTIHAILAPFGMEFGHRVFFEAMRFALLMRGAGVVDARTVLDLILMQKVLPRVHGTRRKIEPVLERILAFASDPSRGESAAGDTGNDAESSRPPLPLTHHKAQRMLERVRTHQFASFAE